MNEAQYIELDTHMADAAKSLRCAWRLMKHNGLESVAKELADTVLDVETASSMVKAKIHDARLEAEDEG